MFFDAIDTKRSFALIEKDGRVLCAQGAFHTLDIIDDIHKLARAGGCDIAFVLPYCAIRERGFEARGDEPILAMQIDVALHLPKKKLIEELPEAKIVWDGEIRTSLSDKAYADLVRDFQKNEIERGNASQATLARSFSGRIEAFDVQTALSIYRKILKQRGQYMAVLFASIDPEDNAKSRFIVGATPERHLEIRGDETVMVPIAGTLRKEDRETFEAGLDRFLADPKEINELFQVVDEEMKIMGVICPDGGEVEGPFLREIGAVVHTEYRLAGRRGGDTLAALRRTLHAPTVVGSPMESAARIIHRYEPESRRYYAGEIGVYSNPRTDAPNGDLDCAILIRCAEITGEGHFRVQAGGGLVRDSVPEEEAKESRAKAMGLLGTLTGAPQLTTPYLHGELLQKALAQLETRNRFLSTFWMNRQNAYAEDNLSLDKLQVTILNNEDDFAFMIGHVLRVFKAEVQVVDSLKFDPEKPGTGIVIIGPGPGDPTRPQENHRTGHPEERQNSGTAQRQCAIVVRAVAENPVALLIGGRPSVPALAGQERPDRTEDPGQRGVLVLIPILADAQPFHAGGEVIGFVNGVIEDRVGGDDPDGSNQDQHQNRGARMALQEGDCRGGRWTDDRGGFDGDWALLLPGRHILRI